MTSFRHNSHSQWVSRSQKHIVVTTNYRANIFGFPNARGLNQTNFGLQDQRAGVIRQQVSLPPTWRYQWAGNFTNISPLRWMGAYHYSDLYMFFSSYVIAPGTIPQLETDTSAAMQDYLYTFANDPYNGLTNGGYSQYLPLDGKGGQIARFGTSGKASQLVPGDDVEAVCHIPGAVYDTSP
ncbi:hypothetical protein BDV96DRAFT_648752 [Lophiotrema nucula]|uniref:Uncharacterized protein n=1 Tax=Lophiotrema nucula TaxID=690887 RepID=A0A6A5Z499_9PLEO|nr:hypothetical protein BDV96DRAFT_648752 [Lophiotrema nucula]